MTTDCTANPDDDLDWVLADLFRFYDQTPLYVAVARTAAGVEAAFRAAWDGCTDAGALMRVLRQADRRDDEDFLFRLWEAWPSPAGNPFVKRDEADLCAAMRAAVAPPTLAQISDWQVRRGIE